MGLVLLAANKQLESYSKISISKVAFSLVSIVQILYCWFHRDLSSTYFLGVALKSFLTIIVLAGTFHPIVFSGTPGNQLYHKF